jgi:perosamine synthetase
MPTIGKAELAAVGRVLKRGYLASGPEVVALEKKFAGHHNVAYALATSTGVGALHIALEALRVRGGEVVIPTYVCTAVLNAVRLAGATARIVDTDPDTHNIDPAEVEKGINRKTRAVIVPHMFGLPADVKAIKALGVPVVEDCAMSLGAPIARKLAGPRGNVSIFSFYATKMIASGQGGMLVTRNPKLFNRARDLITYDKRQSYRLRYNYQMTDVAAAIARVQMRRLSGFVLRRRSIAHTYATAFADLRLGLPAGKGHIFYRYVLKVPRGMRSKFIQGLEFRGIDAKAPVFRPLHMYLGFSQKDYPKTKTYYTRLVSIPIYPSLSRADIDRVISAVRKTAKKI